MIVLTLFLFLITALVAVLPIQPDGKLSYIFLLILVVVTVLIAGFRVGSQFPDYSSYLLLYEDIKTEDVIVELSFFYLSKLVQLVYDNVLILFFIYALIGVSLKILAVRKLTELWMLSLVVYVSNFFILHEMIQIRAGVASAFLLLCIKPIYERDLKKFLMFSMLGIFFHFSALVILPLWFIPKIRKNLLLIILPLLVPISYAIFFLKLTILNFIPIPYVQEKLDLYITLQELGTADFLTGINVLNYVFIAKIGVFYFLLYKSKMLLEYNKYTMLMLSIYAVALFMYPALAMMPVMATRVSELLGIVEIGLFPLVYYTISPKYLPKILIITWSLGILLINIFKSNLIF